MKNLMNHEYLSSDNVPAIYDMADEESKHEAYKKIQAGDDLWVSFISEAGRSFVYWRFSETKKVAHVHSSGGEDTRHYPLIGDNLELGEFNSSEEALRAVDEYLRTSKENADSVD